MLGNKGFVWENLDFSPGPSGGGSRAEIRPAYITLENGELFSPGLIIAFATFLGKASLADVVATVSQTSPSATREWLQFRRF